MTLDSQAAEDDSIERTANLIGAMSLGIADAVDRAMKAAEQVHPTTATALMVLRQFPGITISRLERFLAISRPATIRVVNELERENLACRRPSPSDQRQSLVRLTEDGLQTAERLMEIRRSVLRAVLEGMSLEEREALDSTVNNVLGQLTSTVDKAHELCRQCEIVCCPQDQCPVEQRAIELGGGGIGAVTS